MQNRHHSSQSRPEPTSSRDGKSVAKQIVAPMFAALAIDLLDLATFGPIGLYTGLILGAIVGYWLAPFLGFPPHRRWVAALATGVYCTIPLTGLIPLATLGSVLSRSLLREHPRVDAAHPPDPGAVIDVEYEVVSEEPARRNIDTDDDGSETRHTK